MNAADKQKIFTFINNTHFQDEETSALCKSFEEMYLDAKRYNTLIESNAYSPSDFGSSPWGLRTGSGVAKKHELDAAVDRVIEAKRAKALSNPDTAVEIADSLLSIRKSVSELLTCGDEEAIYDHVMLMLQNLDAVIIKHDLK